MATQGPRLEDDTFERLREQVATAAALCSEDQLLQLADSLHDAIRRRKAARSGSLLSWARTDEPSLQGFYN